MATNLTLGTLFTADVKDFLAGINQIKTALNSLHQTFTQTGSNAAAMGKGVAQGIDATTTAIKKQNAAIESSKQQLTGLAGMWQRVKQAMVTSLAYGTAGAAIYAVIDGFKKGISAITDYDQALKNLQAITGATDSEMLGLADTIKEVSSKYIFSTKEIADGAVLMGQAGFTATQTMQAMDAAAKLAMGTLEDMSLTVDLLTTTIVSFQMKSVESTRVADVMANAMNKSKLTLDKLRVSFNYVASAAYEAGVSLEETAAAMSVMANAGMRASTIGTSLRQLLANLIAPNRRVREEFQGMGIDLSGLDPKLVGFSKVMENLGKVLIDQRTGLVDMGKAYSLFGLRAAQAAAVLARSASEDYPRMLAMMYEVGSASTMAGKQMEGLVARFKNLAANAQLIAIALGEGGFIKILRMLADALLLVVKGIKSFVESGIGQIAIQFHVMSAATMAFILVMSKLTTLLLGAGVTALAFFGVQLAKISMLINSLRLMSAIDAFKSLFMALSSGHPVLIAVSVAVGALITAISYLSDSEKRHIETVERTSNVYQTATDTIDAYIDILTELQDKKKKGQNIDVAYESSIKRLLEDYPLLSGSINTNTKSLDENKKKLMEISRESNTLYIEEQIKRLKELDTQLANMGFDQFKDKASKAFEFKVSDELGMNLVETTKQLKTASLGSADLAKQLLEVKRADTEVGEEAEKVNKKLEERAQRFINVATAWKKSGDSIEFITQKLRELGVEDKTLKLVLDKIKKFGDDVSKEAQDIEKAMQNLPNAFIKFFEGLDAMSKVSFAKAAKAMESEVAEYEKTAKTILKTEEDRYAAEAFIRTKHLMKFADDVMKEKMTAEQLLAFKQNLIEKEREMFRDRIEEQMRKNRQVYELELAMAKGNSEKIEEATKKYYARLLELRKAMVQTDLAVTQGGIAQEIEAYKKLSEEVVKTGEKMADDYLKALDRMVAESKDKIKKLQKEKAKIDLDTDEKIRKLRQIGMTDEQKWNDDRAAAYKMLSAAREAMYKGDYEGAKSLLSKTSDISDGLVKEVKDKNGQVIKSEKQTRDEVIDLLLQVASVQKETIDRQIKAEEDKARVAETLAKNLTQLMKDYGKEWDKLNDVKMKLFISSLNDVADRTDKIAERTENIRKDWEIVTGKLAKAPKPPVPTAGAKPGLEAIQKPLQGAGTIEVEGKTVNVNDLAGGEKSTISTGGKTYDIEDFAKQGEGTIEIDGKKLDINKLAEESRKWQAEFGGGIVDLIQNVEDAYQTSQEALVELGNQASTSTETVNANVVQGITEAASAASTAIDGSIESTTTAMTSMGGQLEALFTDAFENIKSGIEETKKDWNSVGDDLNKTFDSVKTDIEEMATKLKTELIKALEGVEDIVSKIKKSWDSIKDKTVTLTVNQVGGDTSSGESTSGSEDTNPEPGNVEWRKGGFIEAIGRRFGGAIQTLGRGMKLPGYGGGDKVKALLEPGEFVVNKESTSRFQPVLEAINSNSVSVVGLGKRFGGIIRSMQPPPLAFAGGGHVPSHKSTHIIQPLTIKIKPKYMSGDRASAKQFAVEIQRELNELEKRMGRR